VTADRLPIEETLGHRFRDPGLLRTALRHASLTAPEGRRESARTGDVSRPEPTDASTPPRDGSDSVAEDGGPSNERLEFLGDALLNFLVARELHDRHPEFGEGELTRARASIINNRELCRVGKELGVHAFLETHDSVRGKGGGVSRKMVADAVEAIFAALYLDGGEDAALGLLRTRFLSALRPEGHVAAFDAKTRLQEICQRERLPLPLYETISRSGPDHAPRFTVRARVRIGGGMEAVATGRSRKEAEGECASLLLDRLESKLVENR
jgi:ribonuclease-3